jgi:hypothetical protein
VSAPTDGGAGVYLARLLEDLQAIAGAVGDTVMTLRVGDAGDSRQIAQSATIHRAMDLLRQQHKAIHKAPRFVKLTAGAAAVAPDGSILVRMHALDALGRVFVHEADANNQPAWRRLEGDERRDPRPR